jgi:predicted metal-dependent phosphoesterase TrpH
MILPAFASPGRFYRGNLHTHSTLSDGTLAPKEVCRRYKAEGYDFIALTDHMNGIYGYPIADTVPFRDAGFTTILGAELHAGTMQNGELWHILAVGLPADFTPAHAPAFVPVADQETGPELAQRAVEAGAFVAIAHPQWSGMTLDDARSLTAAHAVETYNHGCAVGCDRPDGFQLADLLLTEGRELTMIATDDAHFSELDHFGGWVMVKSEELTPGALLAALKAGYFYSSQGPELHSVEVTDTTVLIESSAIAAVIVQGQGSAAQALHGTSMTRTTIRLDRCAKSQWLRVTVIDRAGRRAWTNPLRRSPR